MTAIVVPPTRFAAKLSASLAPSLSHAALAAVIRAAPVAGKPLYFEVPGAAPGATVASCQWYRNAGLGAGPTAITGATSNPIASVPTDMGWPSIRGVMSDGTTFGSPEFTTKSASISISDVTVGTSTDYSIYFGTAQNAHSVGTVSTLQCSVGGAYVNCVIAPGTYNAYSGAYGTGVLAAYGNTFAIQTPLIATSSPATITPAADSAPATATRPTGNTGTGFFVRYGALYDANGNKFRIRGVNVLHYDSAIPGLWNTGANLIRPFMYLNQSWTGINKPLLDSYIAHKMVPMLCSTYVQTSFSATFSGTSMTITSKTYGNLYVDMPIPAGNGVVAAVITALASGTGGVGSVYTLSVSQATITTPVAISNQVSTTSTPSSTTGLPNSPNILHAMVQNWIDQRSNIAAYDGNCLLNIANEWGPAATASNRVWCDGHIASVADLRAAGNLMPLAIDAGGVGQDTFAFTNVNANGKTYAQEVWESDPQRNLVFSYHVYGNTSPGDLDALLTKFNALTASTGMAFIIGEYGPAKITVSGSHTFTEALEVIAVAEAHNVGHIAWAADDSANWIFDTGNYALIKNAGAFAGGGGFQSGTGTIASLSGLVGGSGYTNGTYPAVSLTGGAGTFAYATITVAGGAVTKCDISFSEGGTLATGGRGYAVGNTLSASSATLGLSGSGFSVTVASITSSLSGNPAELTQFGRDVIRHPVHGLLALAQPASIF